MYSSFSDKRNGLEVSHQLPHSNQNINELEKGIVITMRHGSTDSGKNILFSCILFTLKQSWLRIPLGVVKYLIFYFLRSSNDAKLGHWVSTLNMQYIKN